MDEDKVKYIRDIVEENPKGVPIIDIRAQTGLSYPTIKKIAINLGYRIERKKMVRTKLISIIVK